MNEYLKTIEKLVLKYVTIEETNIAFHAGTIELTKTAKEFINPLIETFMKPSKYEQCLKTLYMRMFLLVQSLAKLDNAEDFQTVISTSRTLFEIYADIKLMVKYFPEDPLLPEKFEEIAIFKRFQKANRLSEFLKENPQFEDNGSAKEFSEDEKVINKLSTLCSKFDWDLNSKGLPKPIEHWSGIKQLFQRLEKLDVKDELMYKEFYHIQSYFIHGSGDGLFKISDSMLKGLFSHGHHYSQNIFIESVDLVAKELKISKAIEGLIDELKMASNKSGELIELIVKQKSSSQMK